MKKIVVIFLLVLYGAATIGATIHLHYCMDKFVGWSVGHGDNDKKCGKCGMKEKKGGCCKDVHKEVKLTAEHQKAAVTQNIQLPEASVLPALPETSRFNVTAKALSLPCSNAPSKIPKERLYMLHGVFRI